MTKISMQTTTVVLALAFVVGCGIDDLIVQEATGGQGGGGAQARGGTSGTSGTGGNTTGGGSGGASSAASGGGKPASADGGTGGGGKAGSAGAGTGGGASKAGAGAAASGGTGPAGQGNEAELLRAVDEFIAQECDKLVRCAPFVVEGQFGGAEGCRTRWHLYYDWLVRLPDVGWTGAKISACKSAIDALSCRQFVDDDGRPECLIAGTRKNGSPCNARDQCATRFCAGEGYSCGTCADAPAEGAACDVDNDCPDLTLCECADAQCVQRKCVRPRNEDESCLAAPCGYGLNCLPDGLCHAAPNQVGASCSAADNVQCDVLAQGLVCDTNDDTCLMLTGADTCSATTYCRQLGAVCDRNTGSCSAPPTDTGPCAANDSCNYPARCVSGRCQLPGAGSACP